MKSKRLLSCLLALTMVLAMTALPASAATTFPDVQTHWAKSYIEEMTAKNMFKGYDDGTFRPEGKLTTAEALALCARTVGLDDNTGAQIAEDRKKELTDLMGNDQYWFHREFAICLETGILSFSDLKNLYQSGALTTSIYKEDLAVYLVRAMQLGPMAERLTTYSLSAFSDSAAIADSAKPYVYLLNIYGIVQGDTDKAFGPKLEVTRAVMSTMLSRSLAFMEEHGIEADLPTYSRYDFSQGSIAAVSSGSNGITLLTLNNDLTGAVENTLSLPSDVAVYENNMLTGVTALKTGRHARVCIDSRGNPYAVRVSDALDVDTYSVNGIDGNDLAVTSGGMGRIFTMDRFTQVQVGTKTIGDRSIVDPEAGYTNAVCKVDDQGRLVAVQLTGGTRLEEGIFYGITKSTTSSANNILRVSGFDGVVRSYTMPVGAAVTVNGVLGNLNNTHEGSYVALRVNNETGYVVSAALDAVTQYVQGGVKAVSYSSDVNTLTVLNLSTNKSTTYNVAKNCSITYNGEQTLLRNIQKDYYVTVRIAGGELARIDAYPGSTVISGVLTGRTYGTGADAATLTLEITREDETVVSYAVDLTDPPAILRNDEESTLDKLRTGDKVDVTIRYNNVIKINAVPQSANVTGIVDRIIQEKGGSTLEMTLSTGEEVSYSILSGISVTQNGKDMTLGDIQPGYRLAMVVDGDQVSAIEIQQAVNKGNKLEGTIVYVQTTGNKYILLRVVDEVGNERIVTVNVSSDTRMLEGSTGNNLGIKDLTAGEALEITGSYSGSEFNATIIIR